MRHEGKILAGQLATNRMKEQLKQQRKQNGRWLLKLSFCIFLLCAAMWSWQKLANPQSLPIKTVQITGYYPHVDHNELRQLVLPYIESGFLWINTTALQDRLQQFSWIYSASVKREWPAKLAINLIEQKPAARMGDNLLVNEQGDIFQVDKSTVPAGLPLFISPLIGQQKIMLDNYKTMGAIVAPLALKIMALSLDERQSWSLQLSNGIVVIIGKVDPQSRLQRFVQAYSQIAGSSSEAIDSVDLRYNSGMAVRFKNQSKA